MRPRAAGSSAFVSNHRAAINRTLEREGADDRRGAVPHKLGDMLGLPSILALIVVNAVFGATQKRPDVLCGAEDFPHAYPPSFAAFLWRPYGS